jgi:hypothetical protein
MDPDTGNRHEYSEYENTVERELSRCNYCDREISFKQVVINHSRNSDEEDSGEMKWIPYEADGKKPHQCRLWQSCLMQ